MARTIDLGPVLPIHKGDWNASSTYERTNIVRYNSTAWLCKVATSNGVEPAEDSTDWAILVKDTSRVTSVNGMTGDIVVDGASFLVGACIPFATDKNPDRCKPANGELYNVADYPTAAALLGTQYGGDGTEKFGVPDLRYHAPTECNWYIVLGSDVNKTGRLFCGKDGIYCGRENTYSGTTITE